jgi:hypothetical protein
LHFALVRPYDPTRCGNPLPRAVAARARFPSIVSGPSRLYRRLALAVATHGAAPTDRYVGAPPRPARISGLSDFFRNWVRKNGRNAARGEFPHVAPLASPNNTCFAPDLSGSCRGISNVRNKSASEAFSFGADSALIQHRLSFGGGVLCRIRGIEQNVAATLRRSVAAARQCAPQSKIETATCEWQST